MEIMQTLRRIHTFSLALRMVGVAVLFASAGLLAVSCSETPGASSDAERELFIHCGNSMRPAAEALAEEFEERYDIGVRLNFGGSSDLLASIELGERGDLYLPHDPYAELLDEKDLLEYYEVVGHIEPIIVVPPGNPDGIETMEELATRDLSVAVPDARYATAGELIVEAFEEKELYEEFQDNVVMEGRGHNEVAQALITEHADAAMVWSFIATSYQDQLDMVTPPDVSFPEKRVTLCLLSHAVERDGAEKFIELATSETGQQIFEELGYKLDHSE